MANRRKFIEAAGLGAIGALAPNRVFGKVALTGPVQTQVTKYDKRTLPYGIDYVLEYTITDAQGTAIKMKTYSQRAEAEGWYSQVLLGVGTHQGEECMRINHVATGKKGQVSGDVRYDDLEFINMEADGTAVRISKPATAVGLTSPAEGLPIDQIVALMTKYHTQTWMGGNKKDIVQFLRDRG